MKPTPYTINSVRRGTEITKQTKPNLRAPLFPRANKKIITPRNILTIHINGAYSLNCV